MKMNSKLKLLLILNRNSTLYYRKLLNGRDTRTTDKDYFIAAYLGTRDARYDQVNNQMVEMLKRDTFKNTFVYYQAKDAYHDMNATDIDMYNGLQLFFK